MRLVNCSTSPMAIPEIGEIEPNEAKNITKAQEKQLKKSKVIKRWLETGVLAIDDGTVQDLDEEEPEEEEPEEEEPIVFQDEEEGEEIEEEPEED